jgi:hypothetical protein
MFITTYIGELVGKFSENSHTLKDISHVNLQEKLKRFDKINSWKQEGVGGMLESLI